MKNLFCKIFGHRWVVPNHRLDLWEPITCLRCGKYTLEAAKEREKVPLDLSLFEEGNILIDIEGTLLRVHYPGEMGKPWRHTEKGKLFFGAVVLHHKNQSIVGEYISVDADKFSPYSLVWKEPKTEVKS